jgi:hypothetical protein
MIQQFFQFTFSDCRKKTHFRVQLKIVLQLANAGILAAKKVTNPFQHVIFFLNSFRHFPKTLSGFKPLTLG